jgi:hypothetical protein
MKQIVAELVKKFPTFYGTWRFITMFTTDSILSHMTTVHTLQPFSIGSSLILSSDWRLDFLSGLLPYP